MKTFHSLPTAYNSLSIPLDVTTIALLARAFEDGSAAQTAVFELQASQLPAGQKYGVVAGVRHAVEVLTDGTFAPYMEHDLPEDVGRFLARFRFSGTVTAYPDGSFWFPGSPVVTIVAPLAEALTVLPLFASTVTAASTVAGQASYLRRVVGGDVTLQANLMGHLAHCGWLGDAVLVGGFDVTDDLVVNSLNEVITSPVLNLPSLTPWVLAEELPVDDVGESSDEGSEIADDDPFGWDDEDELDVVESETADELRDAPELSMTDWDTEEMVASDGWTVVDAHRHDIWLSIPKAFRAGEQVSLRGVNSVQELRRLRSAEILPPHIQVDAQVLAQVPSVGFRFRLLGLDNTDQTIPNKPRAAWREFGANWKPVREHVLHYEAPKPGWVEQQHPFILQGRALPLEELAEGNLRHRQQLENVPTSMEVRTDGGRVVWRLTAK